MVPSIRVGRSRRFVFVESDPMPKTGRPRKEINREQFEKLCAIFCSEEEIGHFFDCSVDTVNAWCKREYGRTFAEVYLTKRASGKTRLRAAQFQLAMKSPQMAIYMGQRYLEDQREDAVDNEPVKITLSVEDCSGNG